MDKNYTHVVVVLDRSGSMNTCASDMEGGLRALVEKQAKESGRCTVSLYRFDDTIDVVLDFADVKSINPDDLKLEPRGWTALYDGLGRAIDETGRKLANLPEDQRPGVVTVLIITDGIENASKEYNSQQIKDKTTNQKNVYNWDFVYLGANQDAFAVGGGLGIAKGYNFDVSKTNAVFDSYSSKLSNVRCMSAQGFNAEISYDASEQQDLI
jgi:uncharacterized protein YegL